MKYAALIVVLALLAGLGLAGQRAWQFLNVAPETPGREVTVIIEPGQSFEKTKQMLKDNGLIGDVLLFRLYASWTGMGSKIRAGEFALNTGLTPDKILDTLVNTPGILRRLSVPEGLTMRQIAKLAEEAGLCQAEAFERAAKDAALLAKLGVPAPCAEGFLFPETYLFTRKPGAEGKYVVEAMVAEFFRQARLVWPKGVPQGKALFAAVTLASIVEKETGAGSERARVAGVFVNRLAKGMLLQTDPTIIYGLGESFDGNLRRAHLDDPANPYNTYRHPGLPPGPICSPGRESLAAVANPEKHGFYYFVSKNDGTHYFSAGLDEHNEAVRRYQLSKGRK